MSEIPNYSMYHLEELKKALSDIDESQKQEEAKIIRELIARGGYAYPSNPPIGRVIFVSAIYKWSLVFILSILLAFNAYVFIASQTMLTLVPIAAQATLLYMIFKNYKHVRTVIKIWCVMLLISAVSGFLSMYYAPELVNAKLMDNIFTFVLGLSYLVFADRSVHLVPNDSND